MDQSFRLPLVQGLEPRDETLDKDELSSNVLYDKSMKGHTYAVKRPGLESFIGALGRPAGYYAFQGSPDYYVPWEGTFGAFVYGDVFFGLGPPPPYSWIGRWLNGRFVGVGFSGVEGFEEYIIAESLDGKTWEYKASIAAYDEGAYNYPDELIYTGSEYVLYVNNYEVSSVFSRIWSSSDLITWTYEGEQNFGFASNAKPVTISPSVNGNFFYLTPGAYWRSSDGISWTELSPETSYYFVGYTSTEIRLFRGDVDSPGTVYYLSSSDGESFTTVSAPGTFPLAFTQYNTQALLINGIWFFAIEDVLYTSSDFLQWTAIPLRGIGQYSPVVWDGVNYIILGGDSSLTSPSNYYYFSTDAVSWELGNFPTSLGSSAAVVFTSNGIPVSNEQGEIVIFPRNQTLDGDYQRGQGFYSLENSLDWEDNKLTTYFNPIPSQEDL